MKKLGGKKKEKMIKKGKKNIIAGVKT